MIVGIAPGDYRLFAWEEIQTGAFMDPNFLREYEDRGLAVHLEPSTHVSVQVQIISRGPSQ
jgi:hypothetical protein